MSIDSLGKTVGTVIDERLSSPLVSGFVISWTVINWKFIVILLSDTSVSKTFDMASDLYKTRGDWWGWNIAMPFAVALAYVYLLPLLSRPVHRQWRENQKQIEDDRKAVAELELLDLDTSRSLRSEIYQLRQTVADIKVERDSALDARKSAIEDKATADLQRGSSDANAAAYRQALGEAKSALSAYEERLDLATKRVTALQRALDQTSRLAAQIDKNFLPDTLLPDGNGAINQLILANLKARSLVSADFEVRMLYVLEAFKDAPSDGIATGRIAAQVGETIDGMAVDMIVQHLGFAGHLQQPEFDLRTSKPRGYRLTSSGIAILSALDEFDHLFKVPGPNIGRAELKGA